MYLSQDELAKEFSMCRRSVDRRLKDMRRYPDRYKATDMVHNGRLIRIKIDAFADWLAYGDALDAGMEVPEREEK